MERKVIKRKVMKAKVIKAVGGLSLSVYIDRFKNHNGDG